MSQQDVRVFWLSGNKQQRDEAMDKIRTAYGECEEIHYGQETSLDYFEEQVLTSDCFGNKRLYILNALPAFSGVRQTCVNRLKKILDFVPHDCLIVFNGIDTGDERSISTHAGKIGKLLEYPDQLPQVEAVELAHKLLTAAEKHIEDADLNRFINALPTEDGKTWHVDQINTSVDKMLCFIAKNKKVTEEDVRLLATGSVYTTPWTLFDAIDLKQFDRAVSIYQRLLACQAEGNPVDFGKKFMSLCMWRFKLLLYVKESLLAGLSGKQIIADTCGLQKLTHKEGAAGNTVLEADKQTYSELMVQRTMGGFNGSPLDHYSRKRIIQIVEFLQDIQEESREIVSEKATAFMVDLFLMLACEKIDDNRRRTLWRYFQHD